MRGAYSDAYKVKGGAVARLILDLPEELISELESRAEERGKNTSDLIRVVGGVPLSPILGLVVQVR